jgi:hypothetical protein
MSTIPTSVTENQFEEHIEPLPWMNSLISPVSNTFPEGKRDQFDAPFVPVEVFARYGLYGGVCITAWWRD